MGRMQELQELLTRRTILYLNLNLIGDAHAFAEVLRSHGVAVRRMNISNVMDYVEGEVPLTAHYSLY